MILASSKEENSYLSLILQQVLVECLYVSHSVVSDSLQPHELYSPPDSSVRGILQAGTLEWVAIPFSKWNAYLHEISTML